MKPGMAPRSQGMMATEAVRLVPGCPKWLVWHHTQAVGKARPQSFSM